jgi:hypothetical protein
MSSHKNEKMLAGTPHQEDQKVAHSNPFRRPLPRQKTTDGPTDTNQSFQVHMNYVTGYVSPKRDQVYFFMHSVASKSKDFYCRRMREKSKNGSGVSTFVSQFVNQIQISYFPQKMA